MKAVFTKKFVTLLLAIVAEVMLIVAVCAIGFRNGETTTTLQDLVNTSWKSFSYAKNTYLLMISGLSIGGGAIVLMLISTFLGRILLFFDRIVWGIGVLFLLVALGLTLGGEVNFALNFSGFKGEYNQAVFAGMLICTIVPSIIAIGMGVKSFSKQK